MKPWHQLQKSIAIQFLLVLGGIYVLGQILFSLWVISANFSQQSSDLYQKALSHAQFLSAVSPDAILANNFYPLETLMRQTAEDPDIVYSVIIHADGRPLTNYLNVSDPNIQVAMETVTLRQTVPIVEAVAANSNIVEIRTNIVAEGLLIGEVRLGYHTNNLQNRLVRSISVTLSALVIVSLLFVLTTITLFNRQIGNPLRQLGLMSQQLTVGELNKRIAVVGENEISQLQQSFNTMAGRLEENVAELNKLSYVASKTKNAVIITDSSGYIEWVNEAFTQITDYQLEESVGKSPGSLLQGPESDPAIIEQMGQCVRSGAPFQVELINYSKLGRLYWIAIEMQPVYDGDGVLVNFIAIETDVTERKRAEAQLLSYATQMSEANQALSRQQTRLRALLDIATRTSDAEKQLQDVVEQGVAVLKMEVGIISYIEQDRYTIMKQYAPHIPLQIGMRCSLQDTLCMQTIAKDGVFSMIAAPGVSEMPNPCFDLIRPRVYIGAPLRVNGRLYGTLSFLSEATRNDPFTDAEEDFVNLMSQWVNVTLERQASNDELTKYAQELERSNRELQDFAYVASHDLQEPLRKIQAFGSRLEARYATSLDERGIDYVQRMQSAANRMQALINDLLSYSRVTTSAKPFALTDLNAVIQGVLSDLEIRLEQSRGVVELSPLRVLQADRAQMRHLFQNLIGNALKFAHPDRSPIVQITDGIGERDGKPVYEIHVKDNGIGFDEKYQDRIFNIFQRLHGRNEYEGTGVGLAICRKIVQRHKGEIGVESETDKGSTFIIRLPLTQTEEGLI